MLFGLFFLLLGQIFSNTVVPIGTKIAAPFTGPVLFVFLRIVVATALLGIVFFFSKKRTIHWREYKDFALLGLLLAINVLFFTIGIAYTTVIMSTLIYAITPLLVGVAGHFFLDEKLDRNKIIGLLVSVAGLLFLVSQSLSSEQKDAFGQPFGNILIGIAMLGYAYYVLHSRKVLHQKKHEAIQTTFLTFVFATITLFITLLSGILFGFVALKPLPQAGVTGFLLVGVGSIAQYLFLQIGVKLTNAFTASLSQYVGPFIAAAAAIPLLHEQVTMQLVIGGILILVGVFIATTYEQVRTRWLKRLRLSGRGVGGK